MNPELVSKLSKIEGPLLPLSTPTEGALALDGRGRREDDQPTEGGGEEEWSHIDTMASHCATHGCGIKSMRRQLDAVGVGSSTTPTKSLVWWYQPLGLVWWYQPWGLVWWYQPWGLVWWYQHNLILCWMPGLARILLRG